MNKPALLLLKNISLSYGTINALDNIEWEIIPGEIHALIGEHGAGKSSLANIISGFRKTQGEIWWEGNLIGSFSEHTAQELGISFVTQDTDLFNDLPVAFNLFINQEKVFPKFFFSNKRIFREADAYLKQMGCTIDCRKTVKELTLPEKVFIDILRHLYNKPRLLILDEALEKLSRIDLGTVRVFLKELCKNGGSVIFITHRIDDIYEFADKVTILRNGRIIITDSLKNVDKINLIKLAYTQIVRTKGSSGIDKEFYNLLKYNEAILEFLPIALLVIDQKEKIKMLNHFGERLFQREKDLMIDTSLEKIMGVKNATLLLEIQECLKSGTAKNLYHRNLMLNQNELSCNIVIYPIYDGSSCIGSIIIFDDITEQESLRGKILVSEKLASVGLLAAGVAHEINNPLEIINNYLDLLKGLVIEPVPATYLTYLEEELDSIKQIVSNLITFSEKNRYDDETLDLTKLIQQMIVLITPNAKKLGILIIPELIDEEVLILANRTKIKQVFLNILKNAFDAIHQNGTVTIILDSQENGYARIRFLDTGQGLEQGRPGDPFLPFYTTKHDRSEDMGLGLSIVYGIIASYSGTIEIDNRTDKQGCIVQVLLPLVKTSSQKHI